MDQQGFRDNLNVVQLRGIFVHTERWVCIYIQLLHNEMYHLRSYYYNKWQPVRTQLSVLFVCFNDNYFERSACAKIVDVVRSDPVKREGKFEHNIEQGLDTKIVFTGNY